MTNFWRLRIRLKQSIACSRLRNGRCEFSSRLFSQRPAIGHPLEGLTRGTTTNLGQELSAIRIQIAEVPLMGSQLAEKRQFGHLALDGARALARSTLPEPLEGRPGCTFSPVCDRAPN